MIRTLSGLHEGNLQKEGGWRWDVIILGPKSMEWSFAKIVMEVAGTKKGKVLVRNAQDLGG